LCFHAFPDPFIYAAIFLVTASAIQGTGNDVSCRHEIVDKSVISKCLPIETEKSTVGDLTVLVTGTEVELNLQRSSGKVNGTARFKYCKQLF
jgi:hypothetical protein